MKPIDRIEGNFKQIRRLTELFFLRFFRNDSMPFENESTNSLIVILSTICVFGLFFTYNLLFHYIFVPENGNSWNEKSHIILIGMLLIGFITLLEWDVLFFDKNDYYVLGPLPLRGKIVFISKFLSFILFVALFAFSANLLSAFFFSVFISAFYKGTSAFFFIRFFLVHLMIAFSANMLVFFFLLSVKGLLMIILSSSIYKKISSFIQGLFMVFIIAIYAFIPDIYSNLTIYMKNGDKRVIYYPQMWFTGLYEYLLGRHWKIYKELSLYAIYSLIIFFLLSLLTFTISYVGYSKSTGEVSNKRFKKGFVFPVFRKAFNMFFLRKPPERGVFYFIKKTLEKSGKHRVKLYGFLSVAIGIIISKYVTEQWLIKNMRPINEWSKIIYSLPFIIWFFLIVGLRSIANHPVSPSSNWIFKITDNKDKRIYRRAIHKSIVLQNIVPTTIGFLVFYSFVWDIKTSFVFVLYSFFIAVFLEQILFFNIKKIPYTCISIPGKGNLKQLFIVYILVFLFFVSITGYFGYWLAEVPGLFKNLLFVSVASFALLFIIKKIFEKPNYELVFEEEVEPVMLTFHPNS